MKDKIEEARNRIGGLRDDLMTLAYAQDEELEELTGLQWDTMVCDPRDLFEQWANRLNPAIALLYHALQKEQSHE